ncbi:MAG: flagellar cap protein FliD N-terminal domain-containing protein [Steroidobacter sp.]
MTTSTATTPTGTSGILQSMGIGSGLDISNIVTQLTTAEMSGQQTNVTAQQADVTSKMSALGTLKSALATFQSSLSAFGGTGKNSAFNALSATSGDETIFKASASAGAAAGSYQVQVQSLAQSQQLITKNFSGRYS